ncbi:MAG TPA: HlyC/CorC family transporter [Candidatus Merdiplasma excrementigallinarum]|uniref:HlyC/CorC family transporter n=1 Tax=Candidatus Merdiplasma excrementigallinarum TaxID=2840864 RepID=A0A9D1T883_9FIRM|nr:HlyC/CorC family transporter [Candidatus Merdiplasma excrementigallinarum]
MIGSIVLIIVFTFLNAVFACAEIAVISMNETKLKHLVENGNKRAKKLAALTEQPSRFLATIQVAITLSGFLNSAFASDNFAGLIADALMKTGIPVPRSVLNSVAVLVVTIVLSYISIVFGELVPKRFAMKNSESLSLGLAPTLYGVAKLFSPLVSLLTVSTNLILKLFGMDPTEDDDQVTKEEIQMMLMEGNEQGVIDTQENEFIQNVFEFNDISADEICTHRSDVVVLDADDSLEEWKESIFKNRHSYYPVYKDSKENIVGILDTKDYFRLEEVTKESIFEKAVEPAFFIPENIKAAKLFERMKQTRNYFAVLLDEYGEMSGIVTLHDLVEALVGDLYEENEDVTEKIQKLAPNIWRIRGDAEIDDVVEQLKITLPEEQDDFDTFNGLIYSIIDRIPEDGSQFVCDAYGMRIHVKSVEKHKIVEAVVELMGDENSPMKEEKSEK